MYRYRAFFDEVKKEEAQREKQLHALHARIGQFTVGRDF